jgi:hypothetical protein
LVGEIAYILEREREGFWIYYGVLKNLYATCHDLVEKGIGF